MMNVLEYRVGENRKNIYTVYFISKMIITAIFIMLAIMLNVSTNISWLDSIIGSSSGQKTMLWLLFGAILYYADMKSTKVSSSVIHIMWIIPIATGLWLYSSHGDGGWDFRNMVYVGFAFGSIIMFLFITKENKYSVVYLPTKTDVLSAVYPEYGTDTTEAAREYYESLHSFEPHVHIEQLDSFFERKESQAGFDDSVITDDSKRLWLTLDEQHDYYKGMQERLEDRYKEEMSNLPKGSELLINKLSDKRYVNESIMRRFINYKWDNLFENEAPVSHDELKDLFKILESNGYNPHRKIKNNMSTWLNQIHHNLYPANRYFENLMSNRFVENLYIGVDRGVRGEQLLMDELALFDERFHILENVNIREDGMNAESDAVIISQYGVFTIEAKNFAEDGQYSVHVSKDGRWLRKKRDGTFDPMNDVIRQSNRHILVKQKMLNREMKQMGLLDQDDFIDIYGAIVVTNQVVNISNESSYPIMRLSSLYEYIRSKHLDPIYTPEQVDEMIKLFNQHNQPDVKFPVRDLEREFDIYMDLLKERLKEYEIFRDFYKLNQ